MEGADRVQLPAAFEQVDMDSLVQLIADMFERLTVHNDRIPLSPESLTRFHSRSAPNISILEYLRRIVKYTNVEKSCLLLTLHYIDQICARIPLFTLSSLTCHRFVITAVAIASKTFCDAFCTNSHYAKVGGIAVAELNLLEREFLRMIEWNLTLLHEYYINLVRTHSTGRFFIATTSSPESDNLISSSEADSDSEMGSPGPSLSLSASASRHASTSPAPGITPEGRMVPLPATAASSAAGVSDPPREASTILLDPAAFPAGASRGPTLEQNMAFEALQEEEAKSSGSGSGGGSYGSYGSHGSGGSRSGGSGGSGP